MNASHDPGHRRLLAALAFFFFCSGVSALVYQVLSRLTHPRHPTGNSDRVLRLVLIVFTLSGVVSLVLEVVWFRRAFVGAGPLLTDDRPLAEFFLSLPRDRQPGLAALKGDVRRYVVLD